MVESVFKGLLMTNIDEKEKKPGAGVEPAYSAFWCSFEPLQADA